MVYAIRSRLVDRRLQLGAPSGIGMSPTPHLVGTNSHLVERLLERHAVIEQLKQGRTFNRWERCFSLATLALSLEHRTSGPALEAITAAPTRVRVPCAAVRPRRRSGASDRCLTASSSETVHGAGPSLPVRRQWTRLDGLMLSRRAACRWLVTSRSPSMGLA
jgi:hypothetical protein